MRASVELHHVYSIRMCVGKLLHPVALKARPSSFPLVFPPRLSPPFPPPLSSSSSRLPQDALCCRASPVAGGTEPRSRVVQQLGCLQQLRSVSLCSSTHHSDAQNENTGRSSLPTRGQCYGGCLVRPAGSMSTLCISATAFDSGNLLVIEGEKYVSCSSTLRWSLHWLSKLFLLSSLVPLGVAFRPLPLVTTPCAFKGVHSGGASAQIVGKLTKGPSSQQSAAPPQLAILRAWSPGFPHPTAGTLCAKAAPSTVVLGLCRYCLLEAMIYVSLGPAPRPGAAMLSYDRDYFRSGAGSE